MCGLFKASRPLPSPTQIPTNSHSHIFSLHFTAPCNTPYLGLSWIYSILDYRGLSYHESAARLGGGLSSSCFSFGGVVGLGDGAAAISLATASAICTSNTAITC